MKELWVVLLIGAAAVLSVFSRKLTISGGIAGFIVGFALYSGTGWPGLVLMALFFFLATIATQLDKQHKAAIDSKVFQIRRNAGQVLANGGIAAALGCYAYLIPGSKAVCFLAIAGSLSAATADTLSSEIGTLYGRRFYNILSLQPDQKGRDGVVSLEGIAVGLAGSSNIALVYCCYVGWSEHFYIILAAGLIGNILDSIIGASLERRHLVGNDFVNWANTLTGALSALGLTFLIHTL
ncbi:MAG TPA: DUF92 domain-containing protein [Flavisolibacter sp.]|nr:DUF92 domain-containing protein [Flavisolibacter sp.]